jgi:hypothetical protein
MQRPRRATKVPVHLRILTVLHFLDQGGYQVGTGHGYLIAQSQPAISRCIAEVTNLMTAHLLNVWIKFPNSDEERQRIKRGFQELAPTFANVVGVVDCTHIRIVAPPAEHPLYPGHPYYCRKGFFSINAQIRRHFHVLWLLNLILRFYNPQRVFLTLVKALDWLLALPS